MATPKRPQLDKMSQGEGTTKRKINYQTKAANPALGRMNDVRYGKISGKVADRMNADFAYDITDCP